MAGRTNLPSLQQPGHIFKKGDDMQKNDRGKYLDNSGKVDWRRLANDLIEKQKPKYEREQKQKERKEQWWEK